MTQSIDSVISNYSEKLKSVDHEIMDDVVGVSMALDHLRKALDKVDKCLGERKYEQASELGYHEVSSEFIFLQRTLGGLMQSVHQYHGLISEIAMEAKCQSYEEAQEYVKPHLQSLQPRKKLTAEEKKAQKKEVDKMMKEFKARLAPSEKK